MDYLRLRAISGALSDCRSSAVPCPLISLNRVRGVQEIRVAERLPGLTVGLHTRADAPLTRPAAALARLLLDIGRTLLQRA